MAEVYVQQNLIQVLWIIDKLDWAGPHSSSPLGSPFGQTKRMCICIISSRHVKNTSQAFQTPSITFQTPYRHPSAFEIALKSYPVWWWWWWLANTYIVMPLHGPTCKIARFQVELKFPSWTECGNYAKMTFNFFKQKLQMAALLVWIFYFSNWKFRNWDLIFSGLVLVLLLKR